MSSSAADNAPKKLFKSQEQWARWLDENYGNSGGVWLRFAKKNSSLKSLSYGEALEVALCYGWIDAQLKSENEQTYLQRFVPRAARSVWSKVNREKALELIESGKMRAAGLAAIERAKQNGRWEAAYDPASKAAIPDDLQAALAANPAAKSFFDTLDGANRYAILWRLQTTVRAGTRTRKIEQFVAMLERGEKIHKERS